ncbi:MAG: zinc-binding alcohol dehydrogenase family protein [Dehalococcoidia bacterium]
MRFYEEGGPEVLKLEEAEMPEPGAGEARMRVDVTGVSYADVLQRQGRYIFRVKLPYAPGARIVGTVDKVGPGVDASLVGKQCYAFVTSGAYAEYAVGSVNMLRPLPEGVDPVTAFSVLAEGDVAALSFRVAGRLQPGESVFVPAATGGIGFVALQLAKLYGAGKVFGGASSEKKRAVVAEFGAIPIDYTKADWPKEVIAQTDGKGVDLSFEVNGGQSVYDTLEATRAGGRMVNYGNISDTNAPVNPRQLLRRNQALIGFSRGNSITDNLYLEEKEMVNKELDDFLAAGQLRPLVAGVFNLENIAEGHLLLEGREAIGKVIVLPNG